jgi:hypothetical protein
MTDCRPHHLVTEHDLFYLRSILRNLDELRQISMDQVEVTGYGLANAVLEDNRDWLDCFIRRFCDTCPKCGAEMFRDEEVGAWVCPDDDCGIAVFDEVG